LFWSNGMVLKWVPWMSLLCT